MGLETAPSEVVLPGRAVCLCLQGSHAYLAGDPGADQGGRVAEGGDYGIHRVCVDAPAGWIWPGP